MPKCQDHWGRGPGAGPLSCFATIFLPLANALEREGAGPDNFHLPVFAGFVLRTMNFEFCERVPPNLAHGHTSPVLYTSAPWFPSIGPAALGLCADRFRYLSRTYPES